MRTVTIICVMVLVVLLGWAGVAVCLAGAGFPATSIGHAQAAGDPNGGAIGEALAGATREACTPFSREDALFATPIAWKYRLCDLTSARYRLEVHFRNGSSMPVSFAYRGWLRNPGRCSYGPSSAVIAGRAVVSRSGSDRSAHVSASLAPADYTGRVWLCIREVKGVGVLRRVAYVLPCRRLHAEGGTRTAPREP